MRNPSILLLDEATSALDSASESCVQARHGNRFFGEKFNLKQMKALEPTINPIPLEWVPSWYPLPFSLYLSHGFHSESDDVKGNRVNPISQSWALSATLK